MKRCPVCGAVYPPTHAYCRADGTALIEAPDVAAGIPHAATQSWPPPPTTKKQVPVFVWVLVGLVVGLFMIISVLALISYPTYSRVKKHVRELSAKKSMQTIQQAELMYAMNYPDKGFACNLHDLGGDLDKPPSATAAEILPESLAKGNKDGYIFTITNCMKHTLNGSEQVDGYTLTAVPEVVGKTGNLGFCSDESGVLKQDPAGGTNCIELVR
ncbi:MAG: prepilin-type cleavage/methylation domain-containing protein [Terracidiphilus sp.]|jgi:type IV pilus assembly protein PilA